MKKIAVLINHADQQDEGLKMSIGLQRNGASVEMYVLGDEIGQHRRQYESDLNLLDQMNGEYFSDNLLNVEKYGFRYLTLEDMAVKIKAADIVIPL